MDSHRAQSRGVSAGSDDVAVVSSGEVFAFAEDRENDQGARQVLLFDIGDEGQCHDIGMAHHAADRCADDDRALSPGRARALRDGHQPRYVA